MTIRTHLLYLAAASMALLAACATTVPGGHLKEDESLPAVKTGVTTREEVQKLLGSPSSESSFGPPVWYYISTIRKKRSIMPTEIVDQRVVEISFDSAGIVKEVRQYGMEDGKNVEIASDTTPTEGQKLGFFEQIFSNLGRFNKKGGGGAGNSHTHGGGGTPGGYPGR